MALCSHQYRLAVGSNLTLLWLADTDVEAVPVQFLALRTYRSSVLRYGQTDNDSILAIVIALQASLLERKASVLSRRHALSSSLLFGSIGYQGTTLAYLEIKLLYRRGT